jgi:YHS domain-containing protein
LFPDTYFNILIQQTVWLSIIFVYYQKNCFMKTYAQRFLFSGTLIAALALFAACKSGSTQTEKPAADSTSAMKAIPSEGFDYKLVQNKKDPACGMPVTAGISDTAHYKEYTLGFCSKECKDAFEKSPESLLAAADIAK